jgi:hypothetical protein
MTIPVDINAGVCVFIQSVDSDGQPTCYPYAYPEPTGFPVGDITALNCEIIGVSAAPVEQGAPVEYITTGLSKISITAAPLTPGAPVYCNNFGDLSSTPGTRVIRVGHAISDEWAYIRIENAA